ncbi:MAG: EthD family reductase [Casimicrobiaceae bacterium]
MAKVLAMYRRPADPAAFDRYYYATHVPIAKKIPGLRNYEVTSGPVTTLDGPAPYHLIATLTFDSVAAVQAALGTPEGQATAADLGNFATGGVELYIADTKVI